MLTFNNAILLGGGGGGCHDTITLVNNSMFMKPCLNLFRNKFNTIVLTNSLKLGKKDVSITRIDSRNFCLELAIYLIKKNEPTCGKFQIFVSLNKSKYTLNNHKQLLKRNEIHF